MKDFRVLKSKYEEYALKYAEAMHKIFVENIAEGTEYKSWSRKEQTAAKKTREFFLKFEEINELDSFLVFLNHDNLFVKLRTSCLLILHYPEPCKSVLMELVKSEIPIVRIHAKTNLKATFGIPLDSHD